MTMKDLIVLLIHLLTTVAKLLGPGGAKAVVADSLLIKQQLLVINRSRQRAPNLSALDRFLLGFWSLFLKPRHIQRAAVIVRPSTLLRFHEMLKNRKYRRLFSSGKQGKPGPKGPSEELIQVILEMKRRDPRFGCPRIAEQISKAFGLDIDKDVVRRVLAKHYHPGPDSDGGPSWLTFIGHITDSLWSVDLFRCESMLLKTHWVLVVMDQFTRRIIGFSVHAGDVDGVTLCYLFNKAISRRGQSKYLSSGNDPLFQYHLWKANLRILDVEEIKSVPHVPRSHPFVERLIGTVRREFLDRILFWNGRDLERKLASVQLYHNEHRTHRSLSGNTPAEVAGGAPELQATLKNFGWRSHCGGLYRLPAAA
jgi:transposase InsO family protein